MPYKNPEEKKKYMVIWRWKSKGLIGDYDNIYDLWKNAKNCDYCNIELINGQKGLNRKCMEHNHTTGEFRGICCHKCNMNMFDVKCRSNNKLNEKYIMYHQNKYRVRIKKMNIDKSFNNIEDAIKFRDTNTNKI